MDRSCAYWHSIEQSFAAQERRLDAAKPFSQPDGPFPVTQSMHPETAAHAVTCGQHSCSRQSPQAEGAKAFVQGTHWLA